MKITRVCATLSAALLLSCSGTLSAWAASPSAIPGLSPDQVADVLYVNPGLTEAEFLDGAKRYAKASGQSVDEVLREAATKAHQIATEREPRASGGGGDARVPKGRNDGDIFYVPTGFTHVGMYSWDTRKIIEAPGAGQGPSHEVLASTKRLSSAPHRITTVRSAGDQEGVVSYARAHLLNRDYNINFGWNKGTLERGDPVNCSQLVWYAYVHWGRIDLDSDGGPGVYPRDIYYSDYTTEY